MPCIITDARRQPTCVCPSGLMGYGTLKRLVVNVGRDLNDLANINPEHTAATLLEAVESATTPKGNGAIEPPPGMEVRQAVKVPAEDKTKRLLAKQVRKFEIS